VELFDARIAGVHWSDEIDGGPTRAIVVETVTPSKDALIEVLPSAGIVPAVTPKVAAVFPGNTVTEDGESRAGLPDPMAMTAPVPPAGAESVRVQFAPPFEDREFGEQFKLSNVALGREFGR